MRKKSILGMVAALVLGTLGVTSAQASVISGTTNIDFTNSIYILSLANGAASYSFQKAGDNVFFNNAAVKTGGSALVNSFAGQPYASGSIFRKPFIDGNLFGGFAAFDTFATVPRSSQSVYLALAFDLNDGRHYGYAEFAGSQFLGYGYETVAGMGIRAGAMAAVPSPVPEPGSLGMLALGLALVGAGSLAARRRKI